MQRVIMGIELRDRCASAPAFQELLTGYGEVIGTRIGLHQCAGQKEGETGLILLEFLCGAEQKAAAFEEEAARLPGVKIQKMIF